MDNAEQEWRAHGTQIQRMEVDAEKNCQEVLMVTNTVEEVVMKNNHIFSEKWESTHEWIDCQADEHQLLKNQVIELESLRPSTDCPPKLSESDSWIGGDH